MTKGGRGAEVDPREKLEPPRLAETEMLAGPTRELREPAQMIVSCEDQMFGEFTIGAISTDVDPFISYRLSRLYGLLFAFVSRKTDTDLGRYENDETEQVDRTRPRRSRDWTKTMAYARRLDQFGRREIFPVPTCTADPQR